RADRPASVFPHAGVGAGDEITTLEVFWSGLFRVGPRRWLPLGLDVQLERRAFDIFDLLAVVAGKRGGGIVVALDGDAIDGRLGVVGPGNALVDADELADADVETGSTRAGRIPGLLGGRAVQGEHPQAGHVHLRAHRRPFRIEPEDQRRQLD